MPLLQLPTSTARHHFAANVNGSRYTLMGLLSSTESYILPSSSPPSFLLPLSSLSLVSPPLPCPLPPLQLLGQLRRFATTTTQWETAMESAAFSNPVEVLADKYPVTRSTLRGASFSASCVNGAPEQHAQTQSVVPVICLVGCSVKGFHLVSSPTYSVFVSGVLQGCSVWNHKVCD